LRDELIDRGADADPLAGTGAALRFMAAAVAAGSPWPAASSAPGPDHPAPARPTHRATGICCVWTPSTGSFISW